MDEMNAWSTFVTTGSVLDYLRYTSLRNAEHEFKNSTTAAGTQEEHHEDRYRRSDNKGTKYR